MSEFVPQRPSEPTNILLVDDRADNLLALEAILGDLGTNLVRARSGEEALQRLREMKFAVVLLDVQMDGMSGFETASEIRRLPKTSSTPIIFLTAYETDRAELEEAYALGAVDFLIKPLVPVILRAKVTGLVHLFEEKERARRETEQYRPLVESVRDYAIFLLDPKGQVITWNAGTMRIYGYSAAEIINQHVSRFYPEEMVARDWPSHELKVARAEGRFEDEGWRVRKDGSQFWANVVITALWDEEGTPRGFSKITRDMTERKKAEESARRLLQEQAARRAAEEAEARVRASEQRFRQLAEAMPQIVFTARPDGGVDYLNRRWYEYAGVPESEVSTEAWIAVIHPDDREPCMAQFERCNRSGTPFVMQVRLRHGRTGEYRWHLVRSVPIWDEEGRLVHWYGTSTDIHDQKRAADSARFLADASASLAGLVDYESTLQTVAGLAVPHFADWCGVDMVEPSGSLRRLAVVHQNPEKVKVARELMDRYPPGPDAPGGASYVTRTGKPEIVSNLADEALVHGARDAEHLRLMRALELRSYICVPLIVSGKTLGALTFATAESGRRYTEADLAIAEDLAHRAAIAIDNARLYAELRHADRLKDEFLAMLAHELRNPLAPVRNALHIMKQPGVPAPVVQQVRDISERQVQHMARLLDDLLDVSRIRRGRIELQKEVVDVVMLVQRTVEAVRSLMDERGHELIVSLPPTPLAVEADATRLEQVLNNLLNNAAKYTDPGGKIWLSADLAANSGSPAIEIRVRDTGIGIAPEMLPKIFELFVQVERRLDRSQGGIGIGLTLVKKLVELHGGTITAHSAGPGQGTEFMIRLPAEPARNPEQNGASSPGTTARELGRRVLVVDDNPDTANSLAMLLRLAGQDARAAYDGETALSMAQDFRPEVILLDIGMPGMDGYQVARRLREETPARNAIIIALTGWGQEEDRRRSEQAGFDCHLVKPVDPDTLLKLLSDVANVPSS